MNAKSPSQKPAKKPLEISRSFVASSISAVLSVIAIVGLLTYGFWGEGWIKLIGKDTAAAPHAHEEIATLQGSSASQSLEIAELQNRMRVMLDEWQASQSANLNNIQEILKSHDTSLQQLQADSEYLRENLRQDPNLLSGLLTLIRIRFLQGQALSDIPALLKTYAGDDENLQAIADELQAFTSEPIPSDYDLIYGYDSLKAQLAVEFGESPKITVNRDFFKSLKAYIASLVKVRKLGDIQEIQSVTADNLTSVMYARDFAKAYDMTKSLQGRDDNIDAWLQNLQARISADAAIAKLHEELNSIISRYLTEDNS